MQGPWSWPCLREGGPSPFLIPVKVPSCQQSWVRCAVEGLGKPPACITPLSSSVVPQPCLSSDSRTGREGLHRVSRVHLETAPRASFTWGLLHLILTLFRSRPLPGPSPRARGTEKHRPPEGPLFVRACHQLDGVSGNPWTRPLLLCIPVPWLPGFVGVHAWGGLMSAMQAWQAGAPCAVLGFRAQGTWVPRLPTAGTPAVAPGSSGRAPVLSRP